MGLETTAKLFSELHLIIKSKVDKRRSVPLSCSPRSDHDAKLSAIKKCSLNTGIVFASVTISLPLNCCCWHGGV